jgi:hypothetical protein
MYITMLNTRLGKPELVNTDQLSDETIDDYMPQTDDPFCRLFTASIYNTYRRNGATPFQAVVATALTIVEDRAVPLARLPEDPPTREPRPFLYQTFSAS